MSESQDGLNKITGEGSGEEASVGISKIWKTTRFLLVFVILPVVTAFNTIRVEILDREVDLVRYFQKEIKDSLEQLSGSDPEKSRVALASLYSLANDYDKKRVLISIASSRDSDDLDEAISYLILSEDSKERNKLIDNNPSLREASRRIEAKWVVDNYQALEGVESNADIRPQVTNGGTQLLSLFSSNALEGWMLLGRFSETASREIDINGRMNLSLQKEEASKFSFNPEGAIIDKLNVNELQDSYAEIVSPIYIRQSPPGIGYDLPSIAASSNTSIVGVLCQGSEVKILDYKPIKPRQGNYALWGKVIVTKSRPCYSPGDGEVIEQE
ncbi:hypothetical protein ACQ4N7_19390 [Nodosilinea sp. AN01ver1]|uniref:hypothetical protein n=1 Tax=Nodosilinea sp. AN01ver1 TaxID=3423362 RepID=UPI003D323B57